MKATIIGGGVIGGGWLARFLLNGWDVCVHDPDPEAKRKIDAVLENARFALPMLYDHAMPNEGSLTFCDTIEEAVIGAQWIQESVPERLDIKHKVFAEIAKFSSENAVIGSSTSGFKPSQLQEGATNASQIIVTHPFNPVYLLPLVEVVPSLQNNADIIDRAKSILESIGMYPLHVRKEIDAHIADRLLEAVWREGLWLINDGIATTEEIDNAIRYGFGLRWAQMGLFETYRIAGGEAGMEHFISQFGPALKWPWTKLMDVPELTDELTKKIAYQSDAQSGHNNIRELERLRDKNLIGMMRALKAENSAAGAILNIHEQKLRTENPTTGARTIERIIPNDWTDYNGHMNESRYGQVFSDAADAVLNRAGVDEDYVASGNSYFTVDIHIEFKEEVLATWPIYVESEVQFIEGKKLKLRHELFHKDGRLLATAEQFLLHVDLQTRRSSAPSSAVEAGLIAQSKKD